MMTWLFKYLIVPKERGLTILTEHIDRPLHVRINHASHVLGPLADVQFLEQNIRAYVLMIL